MTETPTEPRRHLPWTWIAAAVALVAAGLIGAWFDWFWWEPYNGIAITLAAVALGIVALVALFFRRPLAGSIALVVGAVAIGLLLGQYLGPARELPATSEGTMTIHFTAPTDAEVAADATCSSTSDGANLWVTSEPNLRIATGAGPEHHVVIASFAMGDMWRSSSARGDHLEVSFLSTQTGPIPEDGRPTELAMVSDPSSSVEADVEGLSGSVVFSGLVRNERYETGVGQADPIDFAGTLEFSCEAPAAGG